ncbi:Pentatricopeptide repeat-containing protein [Seminavis robusta]|uniref:Pentatricopeptide repeat-containing protein n=1 Tax=Seminavis robusta TaxID=568900 RepID=A0A9N8ENP9_9STRA|nr:Pentatricopeptide repeat-containing protein [Seminavis robusta]|eukprot:Sro1295_g260230.1 Pentatricopeptide repeat-containing protein (839) ;mRNA; r:7293-9940
MNTLRRFSRTANQRSRKWQPTTRVLSTKPSSCVSSLPSLSNEEPFVSVSYGSINNNVKGGSHRPSYFWQDHRQVLASSMLKRQSFSTSTTSDGNTFDFKKRLLASALQGDAPQAQSILEQIEDQMRASNQKSTEREEESLLECREAVLDAWIKYQKLLLTEWQALQEATVVSNAPKQEQDDNPQTTAQPLVETTTTNTSGSNKQRKKQLQAQIYEAAENAHQALEKTVPFLNQWSVISLQQVQSTKKGDASDEPYLEDAIIGPSSSSSSGRNKAVISHRCNAVLEAWAIASRVNASSSSKHKKNPTSSTSKKGIPQRATQLIQRMQAAPATTQSTTIESYNWVLESWAWSREHLRATMAQQVFDTMAANRRRANGDSYRWIIQAWCQSRQQRSAFHATGHLMKWLRLLEYRRERIEPTPEIYHMVMQAWTQAGDRNAPMKAAGILRIMEFAHAKSFCSVPVDETCYRHYLGALGRWSVVPEQGPLADKIINQLKDRQIVPDQDCYGAAIRVHKNTALNPLFAQSRETSITRAVELLEELSLAHHRTALRAIKPDTQNYNDVLEALSVSSRAVSKDVAETLITVMEKASAEEGSDCDFRPNADSYKWLLAVHARSRDPDKVETARHVLERMTETFAEDNNSRDESIVDLYNAFLDVCSSAAPLKDHSQPTILQESLKAVEELKSRYSLQPNPQTYANLLRVCKNHLAVGKERSRIVETIFKSCRDEGLVDERVLRSLKSVASEDQYMDLVVSKSDLVEGKRMVPEEWTSNVGLDKIVSADGRKIAPLSVDGRFTITKAMKEYRMRKLRSKANQRVLQGGRLKLDKKQQGMPIIIELERS